MNCNFNKCYCEHCHSSRNGSVYRVRGQPAKKYGVPVGWSRIGLHTPVQAEAHDAFAKWHRAYHGTKTHRVADILKVGHLIRPGNTHFGDIAMGGEEVRVGHSSNIPEDMTTCIFLSPSFRYAAREAYATPSRYFDDETQTWYYAQVVIKVLVLPDSYGTCGQSVRTEFTKDPEIEDSEFEWYTKERGSIIIYGLLISLQGSDDGSDSDW
ncbi:hypothetical protein NP493_2044g00004 [Ridgeia piscesae]|uniref:Uncharacterized protein n=1 Tax=Ridgeia piscesae TaxID=27915 RepID=A0AAD9JPK6_RIDPI|nr:hypothetical protein NP493_2044g00004 [Ridgeia piscesae]